MKKLNKIIGAFLMLALTPISSFAANPFAEFSIGDSEVFYILSFVAIVLMIIIIVLLNAIKGLSFALQEKNKANTKKIISSILVGLLLLPSDLIAAETSDSIIVMSSTVSYILITVNLLLFGIVIYLTGILKDYIKDLKGETEEVEEPTFIDVLTDKLTDAKPIEQEKDILLDHDYDGIKELDNNLPPWWKYGFYLTIIFSFIYLIRFHVTGEGKLQLAEYEAEMAQAEADKAAYLAKTANLVDENTVQFLTDANTLKSGKDIFVQNCAACHGSAGQGGSVGPNLIDEYWLHGGNVSDIFKSIKYGIPEKGMISWQAALTPKQMQEVTSYIMSMQGEELPNARAPQGEKHIPEGEKNNDEQAEETEKEITAEL